VRFSAFVVGGTPEKGRSHLDQRRHFLKPSARPQGFGYLSILTVHAVTVRQRRPRQTYGISVAHTFRGAITTLRGGATEAKIDKHLRRFHCRTVV
jgi:hypothetical protein